MSGIARMRSIVLDCPDPKALADFYAALVGWKIVRVDDDWVTVSDGGPIRLCFQLAPDHKPPVWTDPEHPQQFHLDVTVDDLAEAEAAVLALGAVKHAHQPGADDGFTVFLDPAGHPFCLCVDD
ncbi:VOC family protein [Planotetraspora kaengkrachanensis]|uniref:Glyoxalase n=1 Tax=Planotetraspora kaengkrachanensis TaxID=575193 RepID=A0A8J3PSR1_9ACTN|nr:VOC family protein [Planotetraspora kaengkrachanensis]GIG80627.1 glyoxalase [Planotetraspora kaengkrachanensis]